MFTAVYYQYVLDVKHTNNKQTNNRQLLRQYHRRPFNFDTNTYRTQIMSNNSCNIKEAIHTLVNCLCVWSRWTEQIVLVHSESSISRRKQCEFTL